MFCPKCGHLLVPKIVDNKKILVCSSCNYKEKSGEKIKIKEVKEKKEKEVEVVKKEDYETLPLTETECPKCGHRKAYYWLVQTRAADEPETRFMKCEKCKHTWREYD